MKAAGALTESLLTGRIFDDRGNRMTPSHARKNGKKYRYYLSSPLIEGQAERAGSVRRVPATEVEALVVDAVRRRLKGSTATTDRDLVNTHVARVEVQAKQLAIKLAGHQKANRQSDNAALWGRHRKPARRAGRMVPAIREARARVVGTFLNRHHSARNRIFSARDRGLNSAYPACQRPDSENHASNRPR